MKKTNKNVMKICMLLAVLLLAGCKSFGAKCSCGDPVEVNQESSKETNKIR